MANISKLKLNNITYDIKDALARQALDELGTALVFKGTIGSETQGSGTISSIPTTNVSIGDTWLIVDEARTLSAEYSATGESVLLDIGDSIIATSEDPLYATAAGTDTQGVTSVATGTGLTGGPITTSGTISVDFNSVQSKLVSGTDIKTINNQSLLGSGNISIQSELTAGDGIDISNSTISNTAGMYLTSTIITVYSAHTGIEQVGPDSAMGLHYEGIPTIFEKNTLFSASSDAIELYINGVKQNNFDFIIQSADQGVFNVSIGSNLCFINYSNLCASYEPDTTYELKVDTSKVKTETVLIENTYEKPTFTLTDVSLWEEVLADATSELPGESGALSSDYKLYYECGPYSGVYSGSNLNAYHGNGGYFLTIENSSLSLRVETATGRIYFSPNWSSYDGDDIYIKFTHMRYPQYNPINTIHSDEGRELIVYPKTKVEAISNASNVPLTAILNNKQDTLVSGTNIKTINNTSLLGSGNITVGGDTNVIETVKVNNTALPVSNKAVNIDLSGYATTSALSNKQDTLVSGTNIKTINNTSLLGSGNIDISIPENTGDLTNNGDGTQGSLYATQTWVQNYIASLDANNTGY